MFFKVPLIWKSKVNFLYLLFKKANISKYIQNYTLNTWFYVYIFIYMYIHIYAYIYIYIYHKRKSKEICNLLRLFAKEHPSTKINYS